MPFCPFPTEQDIAQTFSPIEKCMQSHKTSTIIINMERKSSPHITNSVDMHLCVRQFFVRAISPIACVLVFVFVCVCVTSIVRNYLSSVCQIRYFELWLCRICYCCCCCHCFVVIIIVMAVALILDRYCWGWHISIYRSGDRSQNAQPNDIRRSTLTI